MKEIRNPPLQQTTRKWKWILLFGGLLLTALIIGLIAGLVESVGDERGMNGDGDKKNNNGVVNSGSGSGSNTNTNQGNGLDRKIQFANAQDLKAFLETRSPLVAQDDTAQHQAYRWLANSTVVVVDAAAAGTQEDEEEVAAVAAVLSEYQVWSKFALATLFFSTNGPRTWVSRGGWLDHSVSICDWYPGNLCTNSRNYSAPRNIVVDGEGSRRRARKKTRTRTTKIANKHHERRLQGSGSGSGSGSSGWEDDDQLPSSSTNMDVLTTLDLTSIQLDGTLPEELTFLTTLEVLILDDNLLLTGPLPEDIGGLSNLQHFSAQRVGLTGSAFPASLSQLRKLRSFQVADAEGMNGAEFPRNLWVLPQLRILILENLGLTGRLPFGSLVRSPIEVYLQGNRLSGPLPDWGESTAASWMDLRVLDVRDNALTGSIPTGISNLWANHLMVLRLEGNANLSGEVLSPVCDAISFRNITGSTTTSPDMMMLFSADCLGNQPQVLCSCCSLCCLNGSQCVPSQVADGAGSGSSTGGG